MSYNKKELLSIEHVKNKLHSLCYEIFNNPSRLPKEVTVNDIHEAISAEKSIEGRSMLKHIGLTEFADASDTKYTGYSQLLEGMFGYQPSVKLKMAVRN